MVEQFVRVGVRIEAPTGLQVTVVSTTRLDLDWSDVANPPGGTLANYRIYRNEQFLTNTAPSSFSDTTVTAGVQYRYRVSAVDSLGGESAQCPQVVAVPADVTAPPVPTGLAATPAGPTQINLTWNAVTDTGGGGLQGYRLFRDAAFLTLQTGLSFADVGLSPSTTYAYRISAIDNAQNESAQSSQVQATTEAAGGTTVLEQLVNSLSPGQWGVLSSGAALDALWNGGGAPNSSSIFEYSWRMPWDPQVKQALFYGGDDNGSGTNNPKFVRYLESSNTWSQLANPFFRFTNSPMHSYGHNVIDLAARRLNYHVMGYNSTDWYSIDLDNLGAGWTTRQDINNGTHSVDGAVCFSYFPARSRTVLVSGDITFNLREYNSANNTWSASLYSAAPDAQLHVWCEWSNAFILGQTANGCMVFGGGQTNDVRRLNPDGTVTVLTDWPYTTVCDGRYLEIVREPVTENFLFMYDNGTTRVFAVLNPRGSGSWTQLASGTNSIPPFDSGWDDVHSTFHMSACCVENHGVTMFCQWRPGGSRAMIYKHANSVTMAQLIAEADAAPFVGDTLQALDFETLNHGAESQMTFWAGQGNGVQMTDTTDADRYLRDHPNAANFIGGGFVFSGGLDFQGRYTPFVSEIHTVPETANGSAWVGPRRITGEGEFQGIRSNNEACLRLRTPQGTQKASGDFVVAFRRNQGVGVGTPHTFWVAGLGAEFWVRVAIKHTPAYLAHFHTNLSGNAEGKRLIISGDSTSQALEETIQEVGKNRTLAMYSDQGTDPYFESSRPYITDWTVFHIRVVMPSAQTVSDGIVELYVNDETTPVGLVTNANMDGSDTLISGWGTAVNTANNPNVGEWKITFTNFVTEKNPSQVHAPLDNYYANIVIRRNTRCPHIRSG